MSLEAQLKRYRLSQSEYEMIVQRLGREPQGVEWALFSALWSEHCSYKSSRKHLKKFQFKSERVLESFGENAGVIDLGLGERIAFKMESHNHPSFIEPYQGAATGVGGILRDIFTMGARPIALADFLCFGEATAPRMRSLVKGVVHGISGYGNCVGVPTITGQTEFHSSYNQNILVNAFALGLFRPGEPVVTSRAKGVGNYVVYVGAKTGRDGIHGASMASESFDEKSSAKRPTVQIGDPFYEKLLIESCIEVMQAGLVVAIQDMGAAGLTSSSFEMAAKGQVGFRMHLDQVPLRDPTLTPEDILLSESQERMLLICEPSKWEQVREVFERWGLDAQRIGEVTAGPEVELLWKGDLLCQMDPRLLTDEAPVYDRPYDPWKPKNRVELIEPSAPADLTSEVRQHLLSPMGCSREWIYRQYDQRVGVKTVRDAENDVAVLRLPDSGRALGLVLGCRPHLMRFDAYEGAKDAVAYPALQLASKGFEALGVTDCLNFGNPERREVMSEFVASVDGLAKMCETLSAPVISGNVSFYNETLGRNITSTPATGVVGLKKSIEQIPQCVFPKAGEVVLLATSLQLDLSSGRDADLGLQRLGKGQIEPDLVKLLISALLKIVDAGLTSATRVVGNHGIMGSLLKMSRGGVGAEITLPSEFQDVWSERLYQVILCVPKSAEAQVKAMLGEAHVRVDEIGVTGGDRLKVDGNLDMSLSEISQLAHQGWGVNFETLA